MKPIKLTKNEKEEQLNKFKQYLNNLTTNTGRIAYYAAFNTLEHEKATLYISADAYLKMMLYIRNTPTEIAWHGTTKRDDKCSFYVEDVMLYPQTLSSATVTTDDTKYNDWITNLDDDTLNHLRFQGHSHVNFAASPSSTDEQYYQDILEVLPPNEYYIFLIMNKTGDTYYTIYDFKNNIIYEKDDINLCIVSSDKKTNVLALINKEKEAYCVHPVPTVSTPSIYSTFEPKYKHAYPNKYTTHQLKTPKDIDDYFEQAQLDLGYDYNESK